MVTELVLHPIGIVRTRYLRKGDAPRQPKYSGEPTKGKIVLYPGENYEQALKDLEGFERIWILSWFDRNTNWKPLALPPGSRSKHGVFATRSPYRPNPLGLSVCRLLSVKGRTLTIENPDLLDKTPVLDLKPYIPGVDAYPESAAGWVGERDRKLERPRDVRFSQAARDQLTWLRENYGVDLEASARTVLSTDPFPHPYRRIKAGPGDEFTLSVRSWRVLYRIERQAVIVKQVRSGYSAAAVTGDPSPPLHDGRAHVAFHRRWPEPAR